MVNETDHASDLTRLRDEIKHLHRGKLNTAAEKA